MMFMRDDRHIRGETIMTAMTLRGTRTIALAVLAAASSLPLAPGAAAQTLGGTAYGTYVNVPGTTVQSPVATLPTAGGMAVGDAQTFGVPNVLDAQWLKAITTGAVDNPTSSAQSTSELENVSLLSGLITADNVTAIASAYRNATGAASDAAGSGFVNLVVNGTAVATDVAPNTRVDLPGVGYVILNEVQQTGDGATSSGITVNMIHVVEQSPILGLLGQIIGYQTTGEIIVGSAASSVRS
jgi:hypothetical protein